MKKYLMVTFERANDQNTSNCIYVSNNDGMKIVLLMSKSDFYCEPKIWRQTFLEQNLLFMEKFLRYMENGKSNQVKNFNSVGFR